MVSDWVRWFFRLPVDDVLACLERTLTARKRGREWQSPVIILLVTLVTWFVYVPVHELLHAYGCIWTGGSVNRLEISPRYGGAILAKYFDFVKSGSDYAGQLTGFDTHGSDWIYLACVFAPFTLSVLIGVPLIKMCKRRSRPVLFGVALVLGLAPFYNFAGDYYEIGSIITTRVATLVSGATGEPVFKGIRSDDIFKLVGEIIEKPSERGLDSPGKVALGTILLCTSFALSILLGFVTYGLGHAFSRLALPRQRAAAIRATD